MTTDTLRVSHPSDLLAYVPYRVGYQPSRSIVLVCLRGPRHRVGLVTRVDLPPDGAALDVQVQRLVAFAASDGATAVVLVVYAEPGDESVAHADVVRTVQDETEAADLELLYAYLVGRGRYSSLVCDNPRCCPPAGHPLSDLASSVVSAEMVALGAVVGADRAEALGNLTPADDDRRARVERAAGLAASTAPVRTATAPTRARPCSGAWSGREPRHAPRRRWACWRGCRGGTGTARPRGASSTSPWRPTPATGWRCCSARRSTGASRPGGRSATGSSISPGPPGSSPSRIVGLGVQIRGAWLPSSQVMSASVKPRLAGRQPSSAVGCPG